MSDETEAEPEGKATKKKATKKKATKKKATKKKAAKKKATKKKAAKKKATKKKATKKTATKKKTSKKEAAGKTPKKADADASGDPPDERLLGPNGEPITEDGESDEVDGLDDDLDLDDLDLDDDLGDDDDLDEELVNASPGLVEPLIASSDDMDEDAEEVSEEKPAIPENEDETVKLRASAQAAVAAQKDPTASPSAAGAEPAEEEEPTQRRGRRRRPNTLLEPEVAAKRLMDKPNVINALNWMRVADDTPREILHKMWTKLDVHIMLKEKDPNIRIDLEKALRKAEDLLGIEY